MEDRVQHFKNWKVDILQRQINQLQDQLSRTQEKEQREYILKRIDQIQDDIIDLLNS